MADRSPDEEAVIVVKTANRIAREHSDPTRQNDQVLDFVKRTLLALADTAKDLVPNHRMILATYNRLDEVMKATGQSGKPELTSLTHEEARLSAALIAEIVAGKYHLRDDGGAMAARKAARSALTARLPAITQPRTDRGTS